MKIDIYGFKTAITSISPELIDDKYASEAINLETINGSINPIKSVEPSNDVAVTSLTNSIRRVMFRDNASLLVSGAYHQSWVESPLSLDSFDRIYWTRSNGSPMASDYAGFGTADIELGLDKPPGQVTIDVALSTGDTVRASSVLFVEESIWGELSEPSDPSEVFNMMESGSFSINLPAAPASGHWSHRRIYMADFNGSYLYYGTIPNTQASITVALPFDENALVEELDQISEGALNTKPRSGMQGLVQMPGGFLAGYEKNVVCFSKPYLPHAWPVNYELTVDGNIKAISVAASGLVVLTDKKPYLIAGGSPDAMSPIQMDMTEPCFAPKAVVDMGAFVVYPSNEGLIAIAGQDNRNVIDGVIDKDEWRSYVDSSAVACSFNGKYWYFTQNGGFVFDFSNGAYAQHDISANAVFSDQINDRIYVVNPNGTLSVYSRANLSLKTYSWKSKVYELGGVSALSSGKVSSDGSVEFTANYYNGESLVDTVTFTVQPYEIFRLPSSRSDKFQFVVSGTAEVKRIQLATTMSELT